MIGSSTFNSLGAAAQDLFSIGAHKTKAQGLRIEAGNYDLAAGFSDQNARFTEESTAIKQSQLDRQMFKALGGQAADVAGAGFAASGSATDILRESASQGELLRTVAGQQGLITEEGYRCRARPIATWRGPRDWLPMRRTRPPTRHRGWRHSTAWPLWHRSSISRCRALQPATAQSPRLVIPQGWAVCINAAAREWTADRPSSQEADGPCPARGIWRSVESEPNANIAGHKRSMWRNEGGQFRSGFNLSDQR
jgi:hypothetical protein